MAGTEAAAVAEMLPRGPLERLWALLRSTSSLALLGAVVVALLVVWLYGR